jgi:regulator of protease activity HflC (stomatin/prohibitin superfamily)
MASDQGTLVAAVIIFLIPVLAIAPSLVLTKNDRRGVALRLGRYHSTLFPSMHLQLPLIDIVK